MPMFRASPLAWRGGKGWISEKVWEALGDPAHYIEPFAGSLAVLLTRPGGGGRVETVGDADGFVANFWRAMQADCEAVEHHWAQPPIEVDLLAWQSHLKKQAESLTKKLAENHRFYDPEIAGRWAHLAAWRLQSPLAGNNITKLKPSTTAGGLVTIRGAGRREERIEWLRNVQHRISGVRIMFGDWHRTVTDAEFIGTHNGVFLDPPYKVKTRLQHNYEADRRGGNEPSAEALRWAAEHGNNPNLRIVLCAHEGDLAESLTESGWTSYVGRRLVGTNSRMTDARLDAIWFSPHCLQISGKLFAVS